MESIDRKKTYTKDEVRLSKEEFNRCLDMAELITFSDAVPTKNPKSIFIVAQPGARQNRIKILCRI